MTTLITLHLHYLLLYKSMFSSFFFPRTVKPLVTEKQNRAMIIFLAGHIP